MDKRQLLRMQARAHNLRSWLETHTGTGLTSNSALDLLNDNSLMILEIQKLGLEIDELKRELAKRQVVKEKIVSEENRD